MNKKFDLVDMGEEKAKRLAEIMNNKTCKKILDYLKEKETTETQIVKELNLPASTVNYNLQKLAKEGLVDIKDFYWSEKGNKVNVYKVTNKVWVLAPNRSKIFESKLVAALAVAMVAILVFAVIFYNQEVQYTSKLARFGSGEELIKAFERAEGRGEFLGGFVKGGTIAGGSIVMESAVPATAGRDFSTTNIQVEGVDEADKVKTDGEYIYILTDKKLIIAKAYPGDEAEILTNLDLENFYPNELFIHEDRLLIFGTQNYPENKSEENIFPIYRSMTAVKLYDTSNKREPKLLKTVELEGYYLTSRKIGSYVYFVVNSYPRLFEERKLCEDIMPLYREGKEITQVEMKPIVKCTEVGYVEPIQAENFISIMAFSMTDENKELKKEVIVGSGQNVYASLENLYIVQTSWPGILGALKEDEKTIITKFGLDKGEIKFLGKGEVKGYILNQFSMDEFEENFRIATTKGEVWDSKEKSTNNIYILNKNLEVIGSLEGLAPGEKIYSVRFMGERGYVVTFKKIDPLFVIDLANSKNPKVLGKLKIPGYSDYLHPYDETHLIGIGKETVEAEESLKQGRNLDFAWYQGLKIAIFDVSDVENPRELYKEVIGDRGTDSPVLYDHKAFLFDKDKELMVLPVSLAEIKGEKTSANQYGEYTFQGAYVYNINLEEGFKLKGRVTHFKEEDFKKFGFYIEGGAAIERGLYIKDILYTISREKIKLNSLEDLEEKKELVF